MFSVSHHRTSRRPRRRDRRGAAIAEFAICSPIVFFLFLGMLEVSRFHIVRHSLDQAVYMGARVGIVPGATAGEVEQTVNDRLSQAGVSGATVTVTPSTITDSTQSVTVRASASYQQNSWGMPKYFENVTVASEITLDHENVVFE